VQVRYVLVQRILLDLLTAFENERIQVLLRDLFGGIGADQSFKMSERQEGLVDRSVFAASHLFEMSVLLNHLIPVEVNDAGEHVGVELRVLDMTEVLGDLPYGWWAREPLTEGRHCNRSTSEDRPVSCEINRHEAVPLPLDRYTVSPHQRSSFTIT
jgi:hypothetical protein